MAKMSIQDVLNAKINGIFNGFENYEGHFGDNGDNTLMLYLNRNTNKCEEVHTLTMKKSSVTDEIDVLFYTMYLILKISKKNIIETNTGIIDREVYLCHELVRFFGVDFVIFKLHEWKGLWDKEVVNVIIDSIRIAFMRWPYSFYYHGEYCKVLINDKSYDLEAYCTDVYPQELMEYSTTITESIFAIIRFYWYAFTHKKAMTQDMFNTLSKIMGDNYFCIRI